MSNVQRTYPKRADQAISWPVDFGPWLSYVNSSLQSVTVGDAPDIVESHSTTGNVVTLALAGGLAGTTYRIPVTAVAANSQTKTYIIECDVLGVAPASPGGGAGVSDHGALTGLADDDHPQYLNNARGDARYAALAHVHTGAQALAWLDGYFGVGGLDEHIRDVIAAFVVQGVNVTVTHNDGADQLVIASAGAGGGATLADGNYGDVTVSGTGTVITINTNAVTFAELGAKPTTLAGYGITDAAAAGHTHAYGTLTGLPTLGTAAPLNVAAAGDAAAGEVVKGNDTRLSDARAPLAHTHPATAISDSTAAGRSMVTATDAAAQRALLNVANGATANATDAQLRDRSTHTGTQLAATISDFSAAADARIAAASINALADVAVASPALGQVLKWNGSAWVNDTDATGGGAGATNLAYTAAPTNGVVVSDTGTDATLTLADATNAGLMAPAQFTKLAGVAAGATANATDAQLRDRSTHTGTQLASTISDFGAATLALLPSVVVEAGAARSLAAGDNNTIIYCTSASAVTITVPTAFSGRTCTVVRGGAGAVTIVGSGTTINPSTLTIDGQYRSASILPTGSANSFVVVGALGDFVEDVQDIIGAMVAAAGGTYNDAAGTITLPAGGGGAAISGTPSVGQAAEWASASAVGGVAVTGTGNYVKATSPTLVTPNLGTPSAATLTNATGLPVSTGIAGMGAGVATFLATPSSANLAAAVTGETGTGALVFGTGPTIAAPTISGIPTFSGASILSRTTMGANVIDVAVPNRKSVAANTTFTFSGTPAANTWFDLELTNSSASQITITIPSSFSVQQQTAITSFSLPANGRVILTWAYDGATYWLSGEYVAPSGSGTVTSVGITQPAAGITAAGGPITSSGAITLALADDLAAVEGLAATGIVRRTAANTWSAGTAVGLTTEVTGTLPLANGGTNATTAAGARSSLGLAIGTDVQAFNASLAAIAGITFAQGDILYHNGTAVVRLPAGTSGQFLQTAGAGANPAWATAAGGGNVSNAGTPTNGQFAQWTTATTIQGLSAAATRTALALVPGTDVQAFSAVLTAIAGIAFAQGDIIYHNGTTVVRLAAGTAGQVLQTGGPGANPAWATAAGGGNVSNSGTPTAGQLAEWVTSTTLQGVTATGTGSPVRATSPTLVTPNLGTPSTAVLTNATGLPISTGVVGMGANVAAFLAVPSSANLAAALTDETGSGAAVFANSPALVTPTLGTPASGNLSNCTADGTERVGFRGIPINSQSVAYTCVLADAGKCIYHPSADTTARTFTIPANASVAYPIGTTIMFDNDVGAGAVTIDITTDTMVLVGAAGSTGSRTLAAGGRATAVKVAATRWRISGSAELT